VSDLQDVLRAMDDVDARAGLQVVEEGIRSPQEVSQHVGAEALTLLCEAYDLDVVEILTMASARGGLIATLVAAQLGHSRCPSRASYEGGIVAAGILTGLRIGLMLADRRDGQA
jgi:hypothetical protein